MFPGFCNSQGGKSRLVSISKGMLRTFTVTNMVDFFPYSCFVFGWKTQSKPGKPADCPPYLFFCWSHVRSRDLPVRSRVCQIVNTVVSCSGWVIWCALLHIGWNRPHVCGLLILESRLDDGLVCVLLNAVCPSDVCDEKDWAWAGKGQDSSGLLTFPF